MNRLQKYSRFLSEANTCDTIPDWRGQSLERIIDGWDGSPDARTNLEQVESWLRRNQAAQTAASDV